MIRIGCVVEASHASGEDESLPTVPRQRGPVEDESTEGKAHAAA